MHLTLYSDYSMRVLLYLAADPGRVVATEEISNAFNISLNHLVKVVNQLGKLGYLKIKRGRQGGILLAQDPKEIRLGKLVRAVEPDFHLAECFDPATNRCLLSPACGLKGALFEARQAFFKTLDQYTLESVMTPPMRKLLNGSSEAAFEDRLLN
jgi:Rrf2 family transcriptional regulator, nitric oxide-sensitive transcriptional repressor